jgi:hypothetical protein
MFEQVNWSKLLRKEVTLVLVVQQPRIAAMCNQCEATFCDVAEHRSPVILAIDSIEALVHRSVLRTPLS